MSAEGAGNRHSDSTDLVQSVDRTSQKLQNALKQMNRVLIGQEEVNRLVLAAIVANSHVMMTGMPGLGKSRLLGSINTIFGLSFNRIQGTNDLMPMDVIGSEVRDMETGHVNFVEGPIFSEFVLFDEINRAPPKTQSAMLQAMGEKEVTVAGQTRKLPEVFLTVASRNPVEQEGTYDMPEAQLDRFLFDIQIRNPSREVAKKILKIITSAEYENLALESVMTPEDVLEAQKLATRLPVEDELNDQITDIAYDLCPDDPESDIDVQDGGVNWYPAGARAQKAFVLAARALALIDGEYAPTAKHIKELSRPILGHRLRLSYGAQAKGKDTGQIIDRVVDRRLGLG